MPMSDGPGGGEFDREVVANDGDVLIVVNEGHCGWQGFVLGLGHLSRPQAIDDLPSP
jgi:hypothetical protein